MSGGDTMIRFLLATLLLLSCFAEESFARPKRVKEQPPKYGYSKTLALANKDADSCNLETVRTNKRLDELIRLSRLIRVPDETGTFRLDIQEERFRYLLPQAKATLEEIARRYYARFKGGLKVTTLMRTEAHQANLVRRGISNAHCMTPDQCSLHYRGNAFDISKKNMGWYERYWMKREILAVFREQDRISFWDESTNFHVNVRVCGKEDEKNTN